MSVPIDRHGSILCVPLRLTLLSPESPTDVYSAFQDDVDHYVDPTMVRMTEHEAVLVTLLKYKILRLIRLSGCFRFYKCPAPSSITIPIPASNTCLLSSHLHLFTFDHIKPPT